MTRVDTFRPEDAARLDRGYAHCVVLVDGHAHDREPAKAALAMVNAIDPRYFTEWPREVAHRFQRTRGVTEFEGAPGRQALRPATRKALSTPGPVSADEATALLRELFATSWQIYPFKVWDYVFCVECVAGADATLAALADALDAWTPHVPRDHSGTPLDLYAKQNALWAVGWLLLRASDGARASLRARFERGCVKLRAAADSGGPRRDLEFVADALDLALHGAEGWRRLCAWHAPSPGNLTHVTDDPALVAREAARSRVALPVRVAWLGGAEALAGLHARQWLAPTLPAVVRDFGMLRHEAVVDLFAALAKKPKAAKPVARWFDEHAGFARPRLEALAASGPLAEAARAVLATSPAPR